MTTLTQNQLIKYIPIAMKANIVPFITGQPGAGKSSIVKRVAEEWNMHLIDLRLSQLLPYDLLGLISPNTEKSKASYLPLNTFILEGDEIPNGKKGVILFLDEFNSADKSTMAAAYKLILDRQVGQHKLHPNTRIICAGNRIKDNAIVNRIGTAMQTRLVHIELDSNNKDFIEYASREKWNPMLLGYFHFRPEMINTYNPNQADEVNTFATNRTWEFLANQLPLLLNQGDKDLLIAAVCGTIGDKAGSDFCSYLDLFDKIPTLEEILSNPNKCRIPNDSDIGSKWAICSFLADKYSDDNVEAILTYTLRLDEPDLIVMALRTAINYYPKLIQNKQVQTFLQEASALMA